MNVDQRGAILLFAHGARDPDWAAPFRRIQCRIQDASPDTTVELCFLELMSPPLPEAIAVLAARGITHVTIVPLFLAQGGHLKQDLPRMIAGVKEAHPQIQIHLAPAIGDSPALADAIADWALAEHRAGPENR